MPVHASNGPGENANIEVSTPKPQFKSKISLGASVVAHRLLAPPSMHRGHTPPRSRSKRALAKTEAGLGGLMS
ncbi:hypothetical protein CANTEDRAFT_116643 [Yamadazyma tenuis ATCC 10573]|uniref:Uncharacterized protein n=1 Tax=Candida tenuis (strain ATCC 10573 / BCRC 21748 / CBS 615 / JCM 9827 / NBRC 10315 / NRRL Y-1498 / VKM Y-70) TaxID=590646 RepID=G3BEK1_CANTC|nr:uncharacterized protein CANTEDRAFT_116643 [Yamadazyma tenuis ATCC 10573]EGV60562.1 hypothetical protein CANTEDRAFT_116643 [Yamadazyma tenuis ATCC 10573]